MPGVIERVAGFGAFRAGDRGTSSASSRRRRSLRRSSGSTSALVYLTPILGGLIGDRLTGRTRAVIAGAVMMAAGHFLMAFEAPFLLGAGAADRAVGPA